MPAGDSDSEEDTREYPVFTGPYPRSPGADQTGNAPAPGAQLPLPPTGWPSQRTAARRRARPGAVPYAADRRPAATYGTSALAAMAGIALLLFGLIATLIGGAALALPDLMDEAVRIARETEPDLNRRALRTLLTTAAWVVLVLGIVHLLSALGIFLHRQAGRYVGLTLALPGTLIGAYGVAQALALSQAGQSVGAAPVVAAVFAVGYGIVLFGLVAGGSHFQQRR